MSKQAKRKITVELPKSKELSARPSVFDRLGTKKAAKKGAATEGSAAVAAAAAPPDAPSPSVSKQLVPDDDGDEEAAKDDKSRLHSTVVVRRSPEAADWDRWDGRDLEYVDADVLEKRRRQLQRALEIQLKMESVKDRRKDDRKKKPASSSSSSRSSSSTSASSSTSGGSSSSSSSGRENLKRLRKIKSKRNSSSSSGSDRVAKKKVTKEIIKRDKSGPLKKTIVKKDDKLLKKRDLTTVKKKVLPKTTDKKSLSPVKKSGGTPPISNKSIPKVYALPTKRRSRSKSPRKDKNGSASPCVSKDRDKDKDRTKDKDRERDKDRDRDREREREREKERRRSKSPRAKPRSRSPLRRHDSHPPRDPRRKESPKSRGSPSKIRNRQEGGDKRRSRASSRDDKKDDKKKDKDRSVERRKDKHDDKDRHDRDRKEREQQRLDREAQREKEREEALARCQERQRERERLKEQAKRDQEGKRSTRGRDRDRGLNKGLEKPGPDKPVERLLPRPEERLAALAATNKSLGLERAISSNRDRTDAHSERSSRKTERSADRDRDRLPKRQSDRRGSVDRTDRSEYGHSLEHSYDRSLDRSYERPGEGYEDMVSLERERVDRSPGMYPITGHERDHYDSPYDLQGSHSRGYLDPDDRVYNEHLEDHHNIDRGFIDDRRNRECVRRDDLSWDGRETSLDPERQYIHHAQMAHKDWDPDEYHSEWNRQDRHWPHRESQHKGIEWADKEREIEGPWQGHRQTLSSSSKNSRKEGSYRGRDHGRAEQSGHSHSLPSSKRSRDTSLEVPEVKKVSTGNVQASVSHSERSQTAHSSGDTDNPPIPDDLSEISDDADEILNRDDEISEVTQSAAVASDPPDNSDSIDPYGMIDLQPFKPDYEPMIESAPSKIGTKAKSEAPIQKPEINVSAPKENNASSDIKTEHNIEQHDGEDGLDLDFEEISDGELEEDQRAKGLGDALGVDWASLVAEVRRKKETDGENNDESVKKTSARDYWQPRKVLARIGVSLYMAGENMINEIFKEDKKPDVSNHVENTFKLSHPIASVQVAIEKRKRQRTALFGTENGFTKALCARQDLALRRHLCNVPINEGGHEIHPPEPHLFAMAQKLMQKTA